MPKYTKYLFYLTLYCFVLFSLIPLLRLSLPMDTQEAVIWGKYCLWGTTKHPPFSGWLAYDFYKIAGYWDGALYVLSQLCVACGIYYIYKLARCFLDENKAAIAAMLQFGIIYYHFSAVEYNVNVLSVALWPMCAYYFWQAYRQDKLKYWLIFGFLTGISLLNKYVGVMQFVAMFIFVIADKGMLKLLKNTKAYVAVTVALLVVAPHLWWMYQTDFETMNYFASRSGNGIKSWWGHILYPLKFVLAQVLFASATLLTYGIFYKKSEKEKFVQNRTYSLFVGIMSVAPVILFALTAVISGNSLKSMWGFPCLFMWGIALVYFYPLKYSIKLPFAMFCWITLFAIGYAVQCLLTTSPRFVTNVKSFASVMEQKWQERTDRPLEYVGADVWYADILALYGSSEIKPMFWMKPKSNPWFNGKDFEQKGALVIANNEQEYNIYRQMYGKDITPPQKMIVEYKNYFDKTKTKEVIYGFYMPWENINDK